MADTNPFGNLTILETVNLGLLDFARSLRPILVIAALPTLITALYQMLVSAATAGGTPIWTTVALMLPEYLIAAPFYMALLYQLSRIRHTPPTPPRDAMFAGLALLRPFLMTSLILLAVLLLAGVILSVTIQSTAEGQLNIGLAGLIGILLVYALLLAASFYPHIILFDQLSGVTALKASLALFRRYWLRALAVLVFPVMLILILQSLLLQMLGFDNVAPGEPLPSPGFITALLTQLLSWLILGIFEGVRLALFQDLRARDSS